MTSQSVSAALRLLPSITRGICLIHDARQHRPLLVVSAEERGKSHHRSIDCGDTLRQDRVGRRKLAGCKIALMLTRQTAYGGLEQVYAGLEAGFTQAQGMLLAVLVPRMVVPWLLSGLT